MAKVTESFFKKNTDIPSTQKRNNFLSSLWGWRKPKNKKSVVDFVSVSLGSESRFDQATKNVNVKLNETLERLFDSWLQDNTDSIQEIRSRKTRVEQLQFMYFNDPFISRIVALCGDEATQLDSQNRIIGIECPDVLMSRRMYELLIKWGVTANRIKAVIQDLELFGDAFWGVKITDEGVDKITPLGQLDIIDRLEFNPMIVHEKLNRMSGFESVLTRDIYLQKLMKSFENPEEDVSDIFETKLFGFVLQNDLVVGPWNIAHFRLDNDGSEFKPFGKPNLLPCLAPFKQSQSTMTLQSIARIMSFPVTLYKVKTSEGTDEARQFEVVNRVREAYDNIGVTPASSQSEVYSVNTKIWMPDGLMDVDVKASQVDIDFVGDLEMYQDRVAVATGVPKGYLVQEWGGFGNSAVSLVEQYKPFARHVYTLQSTFLEVLSDLFRLHFAISDEFDFRTPFTLSMRFPAEEMSDEKMASRSTTMELAGAIMNSIKAAIGADEASPLPPDVVRDILSKYTFLDPIDVMKWTRDAETILLNSGSGSGADETSSDELDLGLGGGGGGASGNEPDLEGDMEANTEETPPEEPAIDLGVQDVGESARFKNRIFEKRMKEISKRYHEAKNEIYFKVLREQNITNIHRNKDHIVVSLYNGDKDYLYEVFKREKRSDSRLKEESTDLDSLIGNMRDEELQK